MDISSVFNLIIIRKVFKNSNIALLKESAFISGQHISPLMKIFPVFFLSNYILNIREVQTDSEILHKSMQGLVPAQEV